MYKKKDKKNHKIQWPTHQYGMGPPKPPGLIRISLRKTDDTSIFDVVLENNTEHPFTIISSSEARAWTQDDDNVSMGKDETTEPVVVEPGSYAVIGSYHNIYDSDGLGQHLITLKLADDSPLCINHVFRDNPRVDIIDPEGYINERVVRDPGSMPR